MTRPWTFVWMNTIPAVVWHSDPVSCWTQIVGAYLKAASASNVQIAGEPNVQVGPDGNLPDGLLKVFVSSPAYPMPSSTAGSSDGSCEDCGGAALNGGRWCLRCFQTHANPPEPVRRGCGTQAGYTAHRRAGTPACRACKDAHSSQRARAVS